MTQKEINNLCKNSSIALDIFHSEVLVFFNREDFNKVIEWRGHAPEYGGGGCVMRSTLEDAESKETDDIFIIGIFNDKLSTIVHESTHTALMFCDFVGHNVVPTDEIVPYITAYLYEEIIKLMGNIK